MIGRLRNALAQSALPGEQAELSGPERAAGTIVRKAHRMFLATALCGVSAICLWATLTEIDVVTRGSGEVVPSLQNQFVQHLEGGIVEEILIREGQSVRAGDVLMRIRDSFSDAEFSKVAQELQMQEARLARLDAESTGQDKLVVPGGLDDAATAAWLDEQRLFERRRSNLDERIAILKDQTLRKGLEKREAESRLENTQLEYKLTAERVESLTRLVRSGAASRNELLKEQTTLQQIQTKLGDLMHQIPQFDVELSELRRRQNEIEFAAIAEAEEEKIATLTRVEQLETTLAAMSDRDRRSDVRAPIDGKVHRLFLTTVGGVVMGGQNLVQLVPTDAPISVEIRLAPRDRGKVWKDLPAVVKLTAFDFSTFGGIQARVSDISSDVLREEGFEPYYRVKLVAETNGFGPDNPIVAGMSAEVDIITGQRTIMDYLLSPVRDVRAKALREG